MLLFQIAVLVWLVAWLIAVFRAVDRYVTALRASDVDAEMAALAKGRVVFLMWIGLALVIATAVAAVLLGVPFR